MLVTGTSTGIGLATALHFARKGHPVYAGARSVAGAPELTQAIENEKVRIRPVVIDVDDAVSVTRGVGEALGALRDELRRRDPHDPGDPPRYARAPSRRHRQRELALRSHGAAIHEAITTTTPRLRWLVGEDAKRLAEGRRRLSDEEYIEAERPMSDDEYPALTRERYDFDW